MGGNEAIRAAMRASAGRIVALRSALEAGRPWPLGTVEPDAPEAHWGPPEVLAHLAEMLDFWLGELERILEGTQAGAATTAGTAPGEPVPFGRVQTDRVRVLTIERDRTLPIGELMRRVERGIEALDTRLATLTDRDLATRALHARLGEMTVAAFLQRFVVEHLAEHADQLVETSGRAGA